MFKSELKDMKLKKSLLIIIIFCIAFLSFFTFWNARRWQKEFKELSSRGGFFSEIFKGQDLNLMFEEEGETVVEEFITDDGKFKINYPSSFQKAHKSEVESLTNSFLQGRATFVFFARKVDMRNASICFLFAQEIEKAGEDLSAIVEQLKLDEEGTEIIKLEIDEEEALIELRSWQENQPSFRSKQRMISKEEKIYSVSVLSFESNWNSFEKEANEILDSAQIVK
jgi:hypothetical protein